MSQMNSYLRGVLKELADRSRLRTLKTVASDQGSTLESEGKTYVNFSSNNYLGLANHPDLIQASREATDRFGTGSGASRLITGSMALHEELEDGLASFKGCEAALVFNSGYHANIGVIPALMEDNDTVFSDELNHASLIDGCRLSRAQTRVYRHADLGHLEDLLKKAASSRHKLIVTDSVFSMDGDLAPLPDLIGLAEKYDAWLLVDEAHATGVFGEQGRGLVEHFKLNPRHDRLIHMGTLGKALGSFGAYVCGSRELKEFLVNKSRAFIYTTSLPPGVLAASKAGLNAIGKYPELRRELWANVHSLHQTLAPLAAKKGWTLPPALSPILPIIIGSDAETMGLSQHLFGQGLWVTGIRPPTVPEGSARLRVTLMSTHRPEHLAHLCRALSP